MQEEDTVMGEIVTLQAARAPAPLWKKRARKADGKGKVVFLPCVRRERLVPPSDAAEPGREAPLTM